MPHANWLRRFRRETRAGAMVEFAIVAPVLILLMFGIAELGRFFFLFNNLNSAAREGARIGAVTSFTGCSAALADTVRSRISGATASAGAITVCRPPTGVGQPESVRATISGYPFPRSILVGPALTFPNINVVFRYEFQ